MSKIKRISVNAFEKVMDEIPNEVTFEWMGLEVRCKKVLPLADMIAFVEFVTSACFSDSGDYLPEARELAFGIAVLERYANFTLPKNTASKYDLIYRTQAVEAVLEHVDQKQISDIENAIYSKIQYRLQVEKDVLRSQMTELYSTVEKMTEAMEGMFEGVDPGEFTALAEAISDGSIDEKKIVEAYLKRAEE